MMKKMWFVYDMSNNLVLSGYRHRKSAGEEAKKVREEALDELEIRVLPRDDIHIQEYAKYHPCWAKKNGFR